MNTLTPHLTHEAVAQFWRKRFLRQKHVNAGVRSLLRKYGSAHDVRSIATDLLHTLMGNLITADACLYIVSEDGRTLVPLLCRGRASLDTLASFGLDDPFVTSMVGNAGPGLLNSLPRATTDAANAAPILDHYRIFAPMRFNERLEGFVFLGSRIAGSSYTDNDMELLDALCSVTGAVLAYSGRHQVARLSADRSQQVVARCQEIAGGIADHLERTLASVQALTNSENVREHDDVVRQLTRCAESITYMLSPLRLIERNPAVLESSADDHYDAAEAALEAVYAFSGSPLTRRHSLSISSDARPGIPIDGIDRTNLVDAVRTTLAGALRTLEGDGEIAIHIDECDSLPRRLGEEGSGRADSRVLRVRVEARETRATGNSEDSPAAGMRMLADNLETFQALRDPAPAQQTFIDAGAVILQRSDAGNDTRLVYIPLRSS